MDEGIVVLRRGHLTQHKCRLNQPFRSLTGSPLHCCIDLKGSRHSCIDASRIELPVMALNLSKHIDLAILATMAEQGLWEPVLITLFITAVLAIWGLYAFSAAGLIRRLPLIKTALVIISAIYLLRGLAAIPIIVMKPEVVDSFLVWSSLICFAYGVCYAVGSKLQWSRL